MSAKVIVGTGAAVARLPVLASAAVEARIGPAGIGRQLALVAAIAGPAQAKVGSAFRCLLVSIAGGKKLSRCRTMENCMTRGCSRLAVASLSTILPPPPLADERCSGAGGVSFGGDGSKAIAGLLIAELAPKTPLSPPAIWPATASSSSGMVLVFSPVFRLAIRGNRNSCRVDESCFEPLVIIPCRTPGCWGMSMWTAPTESNPEFLFFFLPCWDSREYKACDLPTVILTTVC